MKNSARAEAAIILESVVVQNKSLASELPKIKTLSEAGLIQAICYGVLRYYWQLSAIADKLIKKPPKDKFISLVIMVGLFELIYLRTPDYASVSEALKATIALKRQRSKGFINAVLRNFIRNKQQLIGEVLQAEEAKYNHPSWLIKNIKNAWPKDWQKILLENNQQAPMILRINQQKISREVYLTKLNEQQIMAKPCEYVASGLILEKASEVNKLPGFSAGEFFVQDAAAQLAANLLPIKKNDRVLDACAAPGGKATHLLEIEPTLKLVAIDNVAERVNQIKENMQRLELSAEILCHNILMTEEWWDKKTFDAILLDAPCSATGVIRRHPDIKLLRRASDIKQLSVTQLTMLNQLWPLLKPQGYLLYATCSILPQENVNVISQFLANEKTAVEQKIQAEWGVACQHGRQIFPGEAQMDGFYYCLLQKISNKVS